MRIVSMRVRVSQGLMVVRVCVRHLLQLSGSVLVLVVFIVLVLMRVLRGSVAMLMLVNIGAEQDGAARHPGESQERWGDLSDPRLTSCAVCGGASANR